MNVISVYGDDQPEWVHRRRDHRAIGVVYDPRRERWGNYVPTVLGERYDAFLHIEDTHALQPLRPPDRRDPEHDGEPETWPFAV